MSGVKRALGTAPPCRTEWSDHIYRVRYGRPMNYPDSDDLLDSLRSVLGEGQCMRLANGARGRVYDAALEHGLITPAEYESARLWIGDLWNYAGD